MVVVRLDGTEERYPFAVLRGPDDDWPGQPVEVEEEDLIRWARVMQEFETVQREMFQALKARSAGRGSGGGMTG